MQRDLEIIERFYAVARKAGRVVLMENSAGGAAGGQYFCLMRLSEMEAVNQRELASTLGITPVSMGEVLRKLEAKGLVMRKKAPSDKRAILVEVTAAGRQAAARYKASREATCSRMLQYFDEAEREQVLGLLDKMARGLDAAE